MLVSLMADSDDEGGAAQQRAGNIEGALTAKGDGQILQQRMAAERLRKQGLVRGLKFSLISETVLATSFQTLHTMDESKMVDSEELAPRHYLLEQHQHWIANIQISMW